MPRSLRFSYPGAVHHVTLRCNNREFLFESHSFHLFLKILQEARTRFPILLYNYCVMTNHPHLIFRVAHADTLSKTMHWISTQFSHKFNALSGRHGHLWEGRFRSTIIEQRSYFLCCMAYVDLNPVRAGMVKHPWDYRWSGHVALRDENSLILDLHPLYLELGPDALSRYSAYRELLAREIKHPPVSLATALFAGTKRFIDRMERNFGLSGQESKIEHGEIRSHIMYAAPKAGRKRQSL